MAKPQRPILQETLQFLMLEEKKTPRPETRFRKTQEGTTVEADVPVNLVKTEIDTVKVLFEAPTGIPKFDLLTITTDKPNELGKNEVYYSIPLFEKPKKDFNSGHLLHRLYDGDYTQDTYKVPTETASGKVENEQKPIGMGPKSPDAKLVAANRLIPISPKELTIYPLDARYASYPKMSEIYNPFQTSELFEQTTRLLIAQEVLTKMSGDFATLLKRLETSPFKEMIPALKAVQKQLNYQAFETKQTYDTTYKDQMEANTAPIGMLLNLFIEGVNSKNLLTAMPLTLDTIDMMLDPRFQESETGLTVDKLPTAAYLLTVNGLHRAFLFTKLFVNQRVALRFIRDVDALPSVIAKKTNEYEFSWNTTYGEIHPVNVTWYRTKCLVLKLETRSRMVYNRTRIAIDPNTPHELEQAGEYIELPIVFATFKYGTPGFFYYNETNNTYYECDLSLVISTSVGQTLVPLLQDSQMTYKYLNMAQQEEVLSAITVMKNNTALRQTWMKMPFQVSQHLILEEVSKLWETIEKAWTENEVLQKRPIHQFLFQTQGFVRLTEAEKKRNQSENIFPALVQIPEFLERDAQGREKIIGMFELEAAKEQLQQEQVRNLVEIIRNGEASRYVFMAYVLAGISKQVLASMTRVGSPEIVGKRVNVVATLVAYADSREVPNLPGKYKSKSILVRAQRRDDDTPPKAILSTTAPLPGAIGLTSVFEVGKYYVIQTKSSMILMQVIHVSDMTLVVQGLYEVNLDTQAHDSALDANLVVALSKGHYGYKATISVLHSLTDENGRNYVFIGFSKLGAQTVTIVEERVLEKTFVMREEKNDPVEIGTTQELRTFVLSVYPKVELYAQQIFEVEWTESMREIVQEKSLFEQTQSLQDQIQSRTAYAVSQMN